jgi:hypothetical protein
MISTPNTAANRPAPPARDRPSAKAADGAPLEGKAPSALGDLVGQLGLGAEDVEALSKRGFVAVDRRPGGRRYFKLRWRSAAGRQRVRYLGSSSQRAAQVRRELEVLRRERTTKRQLARLRREARRLLRATKAELTPHVEKMGYYFHGLQVRRRNVQP